MNRISFKQYRAIDLGIMAVLLFVSEMITATAAIKWFPGELYTLSPTIAVVCIVMMRWGSFAALNAAVGGMAFCIATGASAAQFVMYCVGNCLALLALFLFKVGGKEKVRENAAFTVVFVAVAYASAQVGRWILGLFFGGSFDSVVIFFTTDSLSLLFAVVVVLISRRVDGLFEDQREYLIRTEDERARERNKSYYD
ncbi:MAG: hypothetical protein K2N63_12085 [Lachnospiraceae bacterium]|nr:hypothetical protein [Lachnospiraceae bacterium]